MAPRDEEAWRAHAGLTRGLTLAWNDCGHQLLRVFRHLVGLPRALSVEIFLGHPSDEARRRMLKRLSAVVEIGEEPRAALRDLLDRLGDLSRRRGLAVTTIFGVSLVEVDATAASPEIPPNPVMDHRPAEDVVAQVEAAEQELRDIHRELETWLADTPFPPRPWGTPALLGEPLTEASSVASGDGGSDGAAP